MTPHWIALACGLAGAAAESNFAAVSDEVIVGEEDRDGPFERRARRREPPRGDARFASLEQFFDQARFGNLGPPRGVDPSRLELLWSPEAALERRLLDLGEVSSPEGGSPCPVAELDAVYMEWHEGFAQDRFQAALLAAAQNGAKARVLVGDNAFITAKDREALSRLSAAGVQVAYFRAGGDNLRDSLNKSLHGKVLRVRRDCGSAPVDSVITGGRNVKDSFFRDGAGRVLGRRTERPGARDSGLQYQDLDLRLADSALAADFAEVAAQLHRHAQGLEEGPVRFPRAVEVPSACRARVFSSTPFDGDRTWEHLFAGLLRHAGSEVVCVSPYFNPSERAADALREALGKGVRVVLFTNSEFKRDNVPNTLQGLVRHRLNEAAGYGIDVREWSDPSVLHAKTCLVDERVLYVGSANLNMRSFKHDVETGVVLDCPPLNERWKELVLSEVIAKSGRYEPKTQSAFVRFLSGVVRYFY
ncbi:MAG: phosphatidylserine/phosphatidylglycerophosphate/cardiolipin synthase family protein [Elusimicrobia bacterium]|nr:phosphatidylserine/phosphatidylglycerophosphate/cardiolipin synthase family protein [Elusimicrobiota bacterium]